MENITEDHDELVILRVIDPGSSAYQSWKASKDEAREEAERVLEQVMLKNGEQKQVGPPPWTRRQSTCVAVA